MPKISVILPFFNASETLVAALDSLAIQTFQDFECLLINNNATDKSPDLAEKYCAKDIRFRLLQEPRQGIVHALNTGLQHAQGSYIARMDADDISTPNRLADQLAYLNAHPVVGVVGGKVEYAGQIPETGGFRRYVDWTNSLMDFEDIFHARFIESPIVHPSVMWRRELAEKFGAYRQGDFPEDYELWLRWMDAGVKFAKIHKVVLQWHDHDLRLTRTDHRYRDEAFYAIKTKYLARWLSRHNPHHPNVYVWGASKISRNRAKYLKIHEINIEAFIDLSGKRQLDNKIINYKNIPNPEDAFVLVYLKHAEMRQKTALYLEQKGFQPGVNYLLVS